MKAAIVLFPGSNRENDMAAALEAASGKKPDIAWHGDSELPKADLIVLPGGFAHGDYLRCGAMAAHSPIMRAIVERAQKGTPVLGVCNGFQVLTESGLLPGALLVKADRMTMAHSLEARSPLLDHQVLELAARLPVSYKLAGRRTKRIPSSVLKF